MLLIGLLADLVGRATRARDEVQPAVAPAALHVATPRASADVETAPVTHAVGR